MIPLPGSFLYDLIADRHELETDTHITYIHTYIQYMILFYIHACIHTYIHTYRSLLYDLIVDRHEPETDTHITYIHTYILYMRACIHTFNILCVYIYIYIYMLLFLTLGSKATTSAATFKQKLRHNPKCKWKQIDHAHQSLHDDDVLAFPVCLTPCHDPQRGICCYPILH